MLPEITIWICEECGYWRQEKSTGVHMLFGRGKPVKHVLREAKYGPTPKEMLEEIRIKLGASPSDTIS